MKRHYQIVQTWLGTVLLAATDRGLSNLILADSTEDALAELHRYVLEADCRYQTNQYIEKAFGFIFNSMISNDLTLDLRGTPFQREVWQALQAIPFGETRTYLQIAGQLRRPKAFRAVANACGANPVAIIVPCHRVIASNGGLGGYSGGLWRKRALLAREGHLFNPIFS